MINLVIRGIIYAIDMCFWRQRRNRCPIMVSDYASPDGRFLLKVRARDETFGQGRIALVDRIAKQEVKSEIISDVNFLVKVDWEAERVVMSIQEGSSAPIQKVTWSYYRQLAA